MIKSVTFKEGIITIDNNELLSERADISMERRDPETYNGDRGGLGGIRGEEENKLNRDKRHVWNEPGPGSTEVKHRCPVCNTLFAGRTNMVYCSPKCKELAKKRRQRKKAKDIMNFKPHRGKTGEVYFITNEGGKMIKISFIPAINAENRTKAKQYIEDNYVGSVLLDNYVTQVNTVIKK